MGQVRRNRRVRMTELAAFGIIRSTPFHFLAHSTEGLVLFFLCSEVLGELGDLRILGGRIRRHVEGSEM